MRSFRFWLPAWMILLLACGRTEKSECKKDTDCKGDRICDMGACVEPRLRPAVPQDDTADPDPAPDPSPPPLPSVPRFGQMLALPPLSVPGFSISGGGLNLKFALQVGKEEHTIELVPGGGQPVLRWCIDKKCEDLDVSSPADLQRLFDRLTSTAGATDPQLRDTLKMLRDLSTLVNASGGFGGLGGIGPGQGGAGGTPFVNTPTGPHHAGVFNTCEEILAAGSQAEGAQADVEELVPTIVSSDQVTLKAPGGVLVELQVPPKLQSAMPALAKTQQAVSVRFRILRATGKYIKGELQQVQVQ